MKTLLITCSVFNDKENYLRQVIKIPEFIDHVTYDGRYKDFEYPCDLSDDGTREIAQSFPNIKLVDAGGLTEVAKRNKYFEDFDPTKYKFLLAMDSDEYIKKGWEELLIELDELYDKYVDGDNPLAFYVQVFTPHNNIFDPRPRFWINAQNIIMGPRHYQYYNKKNRLLLPIVDDVKSVKILHDYKLRYPSYIDLSMEYKKRLVASEG